MKTHGILALLWLLPLGATLAQGPVPYNTNPSWSSYPGGVTTGGAFADLDNDGDLDFIVANGNDILRQRVEVFYNDGNGQYPNTPQWRSSDRDYHGHLSVGDVNEDGWLDVAVSVFLGPGGFGDPGHVKLYTNDGTGTLSSQPSWSSSEEFYTFSCALGDADGDGDLDLAVATGEPYGGHSSRNRVYFNNNGVLENVASWTSNTVDDALDVAFGDADGDGDLDLAFCMTRGPNRIFFQDALGLNPNPGWSSTDHNDQFGNTLAFRDLDGDGRLDLGVSDNNQIAGGQGLFKIYSNDPGGLETTPGWTDFGGMVSGLEFADIQLDGYPDLGAGVWFGRTRVFLNVGGQLSASPDWQTTGTSTLEAIVFGDVDGNAVRPTEETHPTNGSRLYYLDHAPVHDIQAVEVDGTPLTESEYATDLNAGWVSLGSTPVTDVTVRYRYSESLDIGVTNWDQDRGNFVFFRDSLMKTAAGPPADPNVKEGEVLSFDVTLESTTARQENVLYASIIFPFFGGLFVFDVRPLTFLPFETQVLPYALPIPNGIDPAFFGPYGFHSYSTLDGKIVDSDSFVFTIESGP